MKSFVGLETIAAVITIHCSAVAHLCSKAGHFKRHQLFTAWAPAACPPMQKGIKVHYSQGTLQNTTLHRVIYKTYESNVKKSAFSLWLKKKKKSQVC